MPPKAKAKQAVRHVRARTSRAAPSAAEAPLDEDAELQEYRARSPITTQRIDYIAGRLGATFPQLPPIASANRIFRENPDIAAGILRDFVPQQ